jgi:hypothetical protein
MTLSTKRSENCQKLPELAQMMKEQLDVIRRDEQFPEIASPEKYSEK